MRLAKVGLSGFRCHRRATRCVSPMLGPAVMAGHRSVRVLQRDYKERLEYMRIGEVVRFAEPQTKDEEEERFVLLELRGDRALVELVCEMSIRPTFVYRTAELVVDRPTSS